MKIVFGIKYSLQKYMNIKRDSMIIERNMASRHFKGLSWQVALHMPSG